MTKISYKGTPFETVGDLPAVGTVAPEFTAAKQDFSDANLKDYLGNKVILNIFLSVDSAVCASSVRKFNEAANKLENTKVLCLSMDLPYALHRFCATENLENVIPLSVFRNPEFGEKYGILISTELVRGLLGRAIVILDETGKVIYTEQVYDTANEPNYEMALAAVKK